MQLSPAKGELCNPSGSPALWYKDMYWNKKQRKGLVNKLILEDLNPLLLPCYTDDQKKAVREPSWKAPWKKKKLSFALANSVTKSNYLHIFKPWTDHIHLKTGNPTFLPDQPHSGAGERKDIVPVERQNFPSAVPPAQPGHNFSCSACKKVSISCAGTCVVNAAPAAPSTGSAPQQCTDTAMHWCKDRRKRGQNLLCKDTWITL